MLIGTGYLGPGFLPHLYLVWNIHRANEQVVYIDPTLGNCKAIYWCIEARFVYAIRLCV
jgi:hypothetical protein